MKNVFMVVYDTPQEFILYHIGSTKKRAEQWKKKHYPNDDTIEIEEVEVDKEDRL